MDVRHRPSNATRSLVAYLNGSNRDGIDLVMTKVTAEQIHHAALE
jgi:hypothetical protein